MPATTRNCSHALGITLEDFPEYYAPGDTIVGVVYRQSHIVSPKARIKIRLHGRVKTKLVKRRGNNNSSTYRERYDLISGHRNEQLLYEGPVHIAATGGDPLQWPFAFTIPTRALVRVSDASWSAETDIELPPTLHCADDGFSTSADAFTEYHLEAELYAGGSERENRTATLPIALQRCSRDPPIVDFRTARTERIHCVASQRLIPGMEDAKLSVGQKMKKFFGTSSVPEFWFKLEVEAPSVYQLRSPSPIPFRLRARPWTTRTSEIIQGVPQKVKLVHFAVKIKCKTDIQVEGTLDNHHADSSHDIHLKSWYPSAGSQDIVIPSEDEWPPLDIGEMVDMRLIKPRSLPGHLGLCPSFTTCNLRHTHVLKWDIWVEVADEVKKAEGRQTITLLPASDTRPDPLAAEPAPPPQSESWIQPPPEMEAPPTFADVKREDMLHGKGKGVLDGCAEGSCTQQERLIDQKS